MRKFTVFCLNRDLDHLKNVLKGKVVVLNKKDKAVKKETHFSEIPNLYAILNSIEINIFIADKDFKLVYMNQKAEETLKSFEKEIFDAFRVRVDDFIGVSIHRFHRGTDLVERVLKNYKALPHEAKLDFGNIHLKISTNCIMEPKGKITGYIVNWEDRSREVRETEEMMELINELELIENDSNNF